MVAPAAWVALSFFAIVIFVVPTLLICFWGPKSGKGRRRRNTSPERFEFRRGDAPPVRSTWQPPRDKRWSWGFNTSTTTDEEEARGRMVEGETNPPTSARLSLVREEEDGGPGGEGAQHSDRWQQRHQGQESGGGQRWYNSWRGSRQQHQQQRQVCDEGGGLELVDARLVTPPRLERPRFDGYTGGSATLQPPRPFLTGSPAAMSPSSSSSLGPPDGSYPASSGSYFDYGSASSPQPLPQTPINATVQQSNVSPSAYPPTAPLTVHRPQPTRANQAGASTTNPFRFGAAAPPSYNNASGSHSAPANRTTLRPPMPDRAPTYTTLASPSLSTLQTMPLPDDILRSFPVPGETTQDTNGPTGSQGAPAEPERERRCSTPIWAQRATMPLLRPESGSNEQPSQDSVASNASSTPRSPPPGASRRPPVMSPSMSTRELQMMTGQRARE